MRRTISDLRSQKGRFYMAIAVLALGVTLSACCPPPKSYPTEEWYAGFDDPILCRREAAIATSLDLRDARQDGLGCDDYCGKRCDGSLQFGIDWDCIPNTDPNLAGEFKGYYKIDTTCVCSKRKPDEQ